MRSKEVDRAIKVMQLDLKYYKAELEIELEDKIDEQRIAYLHQQKTSYETVLSYISELEEKVENYMKLSASSLARGLNESIKNKEKNKTDLELLNEGWKQIIRDKIKEIEKNPNNPYQKVMASQIDASLISCLKELLDEE